MTAFGADAAEAEAAARAAPFAPTTFKEVLDGALALGHAAGRLSEAMRVLAEGERRLRCLRDRLGLARRDRAAEALPTVAVIEGTGPLVLAGRWIPDLVRHAAGRPVLAEAGAPAHEVPWATFVKSDPDVIVVALREGAEPRADDELQVLANRPGWSRLRAVRDGRVFVFDDPGLFYRPGPSLVGAAERLAAVLHPERVG